MIRSGVCAICRGMHFFPSKNAKTAPDGRKMFRKGRRVLPEGEQDPLELAFSSSNQASERREIGVRRLHPRASARTFAPIARESGPSPKSETRSSAVCFWQIAREAVLLPRPRQTRESVVAVQTQSLHSGVRRVTWYGLARRNRRRLARPCAVRALAVKASHLASRRLLSMTRLPPRGKRSRPKPAYLTHP